MMIRATTRQSEIENVIINMDNVTHIERFKDLDFEGTYIAFANCEDYLILKDKYEALLIHLNLAVVGYD